MSARDAGHSHLATPHLVPDCPLCEAVKAARDLALAHLAEAVHLLAAINPTDDLPQVRMNLAPIGLTGNDVANCYSIDLTPKQAEGLADAVDSMHAHLGSQPAAPINPDTIPSGEWGADAVAQNDTDVWDEVNDLFADLDLVAITRDVLNDRAVSKLAVTLALDSLLGEISDAYADEDDA
ncbi:hypothetical protein P1P75_35775 [Streptomyces sp. ID05-39B]|uniref:hypothetical protein n=1 Tax=Streptomyces sp. ID05-39B TaxID=3028664 RepID=UPI0029A1668A|nr:hypothetical protein [Streptomyces sp. ID05-39B]MDX3531613.1 hypothetical protein [Streptomyces sp. ID05-39B]